MSNQREPRERPIDPVKAGAEAVAAGYRTVEAVFDALAESLGRRPRSGAAAARMGPKEGKEGDEGGAPGRAGTPRGVTEVTAELFDLLGERMRGVGRGVDDIGRPAQSGPRLAIRGQHPDQPTAKFWFTNTSAAALGEVKFEATDLLGPEGGVPAAAVEFDRSDREPGAGVQPGRSIQVAAKVKVPANKQPGIYRGVVSARPVDAAHEGEWPDAWTVLELEVTE